MEKIKTILTGMILSILFMSTGSVSENLTFEDWDKNGDGLISRSEFVEHFTQNYLDDWNLNDDGYLEGDDFFRATYQIWDVDDDELLSKEEWLFGYDNYYGDYVGDDFVAIDKDGDGFIEYAEYYDYLYPTDYYVIWDVDEDDYISEFELARMVFNSWDIDDTNYIEKDEYRMFDSYYLDI